MKCTGRPWERRGAPGAAVNEGQGVPEGYILSSRRIRAFRTAVWTMASRTRNVSPHSNTTGLATGPVTGLSRYGVRNGVRGAVTGPVAISAAEPRSDLASPLRFWMRNGGCTIYIGSVKSVTDSPRTSYIWVRVDTVSPLVMTRPFEPGHVLGCRALWPRTLARRAQRPPPHTRHRLIFEARALRPLLDHRVEALEAEAPVAAPHRAAAARATDSIL